MRLIDADALRWSIRENAPKSVPLWVYQTVDEQPTAYGSRYKVAAGQLQERNKGGDAVGEDDKGKIESIPEQ